MDRSRALGVTVGAGLVALTACGGSGGAEGEEPSASFTESATEIAKDPDRQGPAPEVEGAQTGGTVTVYFPGDEGPDSLDPTIGWSVTGNSVQQALINRSLTQFARDPRTGEMLLVPDLAVDLGTPNADFTKWTFTLRDDATWETGEPVTAQEVAFGITRTLDAQALPGPGTAYSTPYFLDGDTYGGPYTGAGKEYDGVAFDNDANTVTITMSKPFPDMDYWGSFMAGQLGDAAGHAGQAGVLRRRGAVHLRPDLSPPSCWPRPATSPGSSSSCRSTTSATRRRSTGSSK